MKAIIIYSLALAALTSCAKSEEAITPDNPNNPLPPKEIHISAAIEASAQTKAVTRVDATPLEGPIDGTADIEGIQFLRKDDAASQSSLSFDGATLITGTRTKNDDNAGTTNDGDITFDGTAPMYDLVDNKHAYFVAYYPAAASVTSNVASLTIDGKTDILYAPLYDAGCYAPTGSVSGSSMTFNHALAQLEVVCKAESGVSADVIKGIWGKIKKIEIATKETAKYKYSDQSFEFTTAEGSGSGSKKLPLLKADYKTTFASIDIPASSNTTVNAAGMFAPAAENSTNAINLTITTQVSGGSEVTTDVSVQLTDGSPSSTNKGFERGKKHTAILTFKSSTKEISVTGTSVD
ncbi:MAG: fimbrillin family protein, partial [Bacteroides sp.]|nr:fimbrillin family protein [Bacteroides sp.]